MSNTAVNLIRKTVDGGGLTFDLPVKAAAHLYEGAIVSQHSSGYLVPYSASGASTALGVAQHEADNTAAGAADGDVRARIETKRMYLFANGAGGDAFAETDMIGSVVYATDDHTVAKTSSSETRAPVGIYYGIETDSGLVRVQFDPALARLVLALQTLTDSPATADALRDNIVASFG